MRRALLVLMVLGAIALGTALGTATASAQAPADSVAALPAELPSGRLATIPLPDDEGAFYYRAGTPGGVRIRSGAPPDVPQLERLIAEEMAALGLDRLGPAAASEGVSRIDLLRTELALRRHLDDRFERLVQLLDLATAGTGRTGGIGGGPPIIVQTPGTTAFALPGPPAAPPLAAPETPAPPAAAPSITAPPLPGLEPVAPGIPRGLITTTEIERSLLDVGLFRAIGVNFEFDRDRLMDSSEIVLDRVGEVLARYPRLRVAVQGHTDNVGRAQYNLALSQRRAESVRRYLIERFDLDPDRLEAEGFGAEAPIATNANPTGRALNRRVEFVVLNPEAAATERRTEPRADDEPLRDQLRRLIREEVERARADG